MKFFPENPELRISPILEIFSDFSNFLRKIPRAYPGISDFRRFSPIANSEKCLPEPPLISAHLRMPPDWAHRVAVTLRVSYIALVAVCVCMCVCVCVRVCVCVCVYGVCVCVIIIASSPFLSPCVGLLAKFCLSIKEN